MSIFSPPSLDLLSASGAAPAPPVRVKPAGQAFDAFLNQARQADASPELSKDAKQVRESAEQLVSSTFIMPLFKQLRSDPMASEMFHGGQGEEIFQQQMDQILSDRIAGSANFDLIDSVERFFTYQESQPADLAEAVQPDGEEARHG